MLSGRVDKASIDSETKLSIACVWPASKRKDTHKVKDMEKERESKSKGDVREWKTKIKQRRRDKDKEIGRKKKLGL